MRKGIGIALCLFVSTLVAEGNPAESLDLSRINGVLIATLHTAGGAVLAFDYVKDGCYFSPDHADSCFTFTAVDGTELVPINGCVENKDAKLGIGAQVGCPAKDLKEVKVILANGGTLTVYGANGDHNDCSPVPVTIEAHGDTYHVGAWNGCAETISCQGELGQVDADKGDTVNNCPPGFVTKH